MKYSTFTEFSFVHAVENFLHVLSKFFWLCVVGLCAVLQVVCERFLVGQNANSMRSLSVRLGCRNTDVFSFVNMCVRRSAALGLDTLVYFSHLCSESISLSNSW